jgi:3-deoxy-D-manno-octulosonic-acid transferase
MSLILYNLLLSVLALIALPFAILALLLRPRYRLGLSQRLGFLPPAVSALAQRASPLWLHAPSVGELLATRPFLQTLKQRFPDRPLLISVQTTTAYAAALKHCPEADGVIYFPLDHPLFVRRVLKQLKPAVFFFTETEMWPNMLSSLVRQSVPTILVSGRFSRRAQRRYGLLAPLFRPIFHSTTACCMQTAEDAERLVAAGASHQRVHVTGNFKVDGISAGNQAGTAILERAGLADRLLLIGASTHHPEEEILLRTYRKLSTTVPRLLLLLAPRHPERFGAVESLLKNGGYRYVKRSLLSDCSGATTEVLLLDTLGELAGFYASAALVFVGGSLISGPGGHSVIEPALAGVPVCFGPYTRNSVSIVTSLKKMGGGIEIRDEQGLYGAALPLLTDAHARIEAGQQARKTIQHEQGAVDRTLIVVLKYCPPPPSASD